MNDVTSVAGRTGAVVLTKSDVGLSDVDNVSAADLRDRATHTGTQAISTITGLQTSLNGKASLSSGNIFTGGNTFSGSSRFDGGFNIGGNTLGSAAFLNAIGTAPLYGRDSVVGTVSGTPINPTGSVCEIGSNSNGGYFKYANGLLICTRDITLDFGTLDAQGPFIWATPFLETPSVSGSGLVGTYQNYINALRGLVVMATDTTFQLRLGSTSLTFANPVRIVGLGRWG